MPFPTVTSAYAAVLALIYFGLSMWVSAGRGKYRVNHGDGGEAALLCRIRAHANFAEYVPLILIMAALLEAGGAAAGTMHALLLPLTVARLMHPVGMVARLQSPQQFIFRAGGAILTWLALIGAAVLLLLRLV